MSFAELSEKFAQKSLPDSEVEFSGEIPADMVLPYRVQALAHIAEHAEMPGFRKGKVPHDMVLKKIGEQGVLEEAVELLVADFYPELILAKKIDAIGRPDIRITKLAVGNPVGLTIRTAVYPEVKLPKDVRALASGVPAEKAAGATDEDIEKTLEQLQKSRTPKNEGGAAETLQMPEINDDFARSLGAFADLADLKTKIKQGISEEKARAARDKRRGAIIDKLIEKTKMELPRIFTESELQKIMGQLADDIARAGLTLEAYLKHINKTEETLREEYRTQAEKRARLQIILNTIAEQEKIEAEESAIEEEMKQALTHFPDAKPDLLRIHIKTVLRNEKVLQMLESA